MGPSNKPILLMAHPRACSTAFERVIESQTSINTCLKRDGWLTQLEQMFMTQSNQITCIHEPFHDPYHYGPERRSRRFEDEGVRMRSGLSEMTYGMVLENIQKEEVEEKRIFIKEMANATVPYSEAAYTSEYGNPSVLPRDCLQGFHFTFLIRHPLLSIPSLYKVTTPPMSYITERHGFHPEDAGYVELRKLFDYLRDVGQIGPNIAGRDRVTAKEGEIKNGGSELVEICVIDAGSLLENPESTCRAYCKSVGLQFQPSMLRWDSSKDRQQAERAFHKNRALHDAALESTSIVSHGDKSHKKLSELEQNAEWSRIYGIEGARLIRENVDTNLPHYEYLKQFEMKV